MNPPFFFVHVSKSCGTSFRLAAERLFGPRGVIYDYGPDTAETSELMREFMARGNDLYFLRRKMGETGISLLAGHASVGKYAPISGIGRVIAFLRSPESQLISHYRHFVRHHDFTGTFEEFAARPNMSRHQTNMMTAAVPLSAVGFVGLAEHYATSLELLKHTFGLEFENLHANAAKLYSSDGVEIDDEMIEVARRATPEDRALYQRAELNFAARKRAFEQGLPFVHGGLLTLGAKNANGFAYVDGSDEAVAVHVTVNSNPVAHVAGATVFRPMLKAYDVGRDGCVGFNAVLTEPLKAGDIVECWATEWEQCLDRRVWTQA